MRDVITSADNPQIKQLIRLQNKASERKKLGLFAAEGLRMVQETPPGMLKTLYVSQQFLKDPAHAGWLSGRSCEVVADRLWKEISGTQTPQGILGLTRMPVHDPQELMTKQRLLILESIQDPGNMGTIFRTAEAAGMDGILMNRGCVDVFNPKVVRSTMGALYRMPFVMSVDLPSASEALKENGVRILAALPEQGILYTRADMTGRIALMIGNEANGLSPELAAKADVRVKIPMAGQTESLNAAVAAAILMYEAVRQQQIQ